MKVLDRERIPFAVGGGYAMAYYTGIRRNTKDLVLFGYTYPCEGKIVPAWVMSELNAAIASEPSPPEQICRGTNLAQKGFGTAIREWGYLDGRLRPHGALTPEELAQLPPP